MSQAAVSREIFREGHWVHWANQEDLRRFDEIFMGLPNSLEELADGIRIMVDDKLTTWHYHEGRHGSDGIVYEFLASRTIMKTSGGREHTYLEFLRFSKVLTYWTVSPFIVSVWWYTTNPQDAEDGEVNPEVVGDRDFTLKVYPFSRD